MISIELTEGNETRTIDLSPLGILATVFITMKLTGYIDWSWWYVLSPILLAMLIILIVYIFWKRINR